MGARGRSMDDAGGLWICVAIPLSTLFFISKGRAGVADTKAKAPLPALKGERDTRSSQAARAVEIMEQVRDSPSRTARSAVRSFTSRGSCRDHASRLPWKQKCTPVAWCSSRSYLPDRRAIVTPKNTIFPLLICWKNIFLTLLMVVLIDLHWYVVEFFVGFFP